MNTLNLNYCHVRPQWVPHFGGTSSTEDPDSLLAINFLAESIQLDTWRDPYKESGPTIEFLIFLKKNI